jgi:hypothetical protein
MGFDHYRRYALDCIRLANGAGDVRSKAVLIDMAQGWMRLAEQAARRAHRATIGSNEPAPELRTDVR